MKPSPGSQVAGVVLICQDPIFAKGADCLACIVQSGFFHRNAIYQAYVDRSLSDFGAKEAELPQTVRMVLSAELCTSLAAHDPADAADTGLPLLLQQAFQEALSDRCVGAELGPAIIIMPMWCNYMYVDAALHMRSWGCVLCATETD